MTAVIGTWIEIGPILIFDDSRMHIPVISWNAEQRRFRMGIAFRAEWGEGREFVVGFGITNHNAHPKKWGIYRLDELFVLCLPGLYIANTEYGMPA